MRLIIILPPERQVFLWIDQINYQPGETLHYLNGQDGDGDSISYQLINGNIDADEDGNLLFGLRENGTLILLDTDEITESAGNAVQLIFSLHDGAEKLLRLKDWSLLHQSMF